MADRVKALTQWARVFAADVALSHNSYGQIVAARMLRLGVVTAMDYEGQPANHLGFRLADRILLPEALRGSAVETQGATPRRARFYRGFKEELYLGDFRADPAVLMEVGVDSDRRPLVVVRTPPSRASYHQFGNPMFAEVIALLGRDTSARCVALVRHDEQRAAIASLGLSNVTIPERAVDSRSLMYHADLFVGAGGTMTREAALMGVPTYSVFAGDQPAVDRQLEEQGCLRRLRSADELLPITTRTGDPKPVFELRAQSARLVEIFVDAVTTCKRRHRHAVRGR